MDLVKFGRPVPTKGHFSSPTSYLIDNITISELPKYQDRSFLHEKYVKEGLPAKEIARLCGCSLTAIKDRLRAFGISKGGSSKSLHREKLAYGKRLVGHKVQVHKTEANIVQSIRRMYLTEQLGVSAIARILNTMKVPTKKQGKAWDHSVITAILEREGIYKQSRQSPRGRKNEL